MSRPHSFLSFLSVGLAAGLCTLLAVAAPAAVIETEQTRVTIRADGSVREENRLVVSMESAKDVSDWGTYAIYLDLNRELDDFSGKVVLPDGDVEKVKKKHQDVAQVSGAGELHASRSYHLVEPEGLAEGAVLHLDWAVETRPYFGADFVSLARDDEVRDFRLTIVVEPGVEGWRWDLDGPAGERYGLAGLTFEERAPGLVVTGSIPARDDVFPDGLPGVAAGPTRPLLRYAWGRGEDWRQVGTWYRDLLGELPGTAAGVGALARRLTADAKTPRQRLERLAAYVQSKVRYVAVQIGIGGYRPTPPGETLERQWGDCKDKGLLLVELLGHVGIEAYPALVTLDESKAFDADFPAAHQFNHLIVAIPEGQLETADADPVSDGYFFVDATQSLGPARYLNSGAQGQQALVVTPSGGSLVRTPVVPEIQSKKLDGTWTVASSGSASVELTVEFVGDVALALLRLDEATASTELDSRLRRLWRAIEPAAEVSTLSWEHDLSDVPTFRTSAVLNYNSWLSGSAGSYAASLPSIEQMPGLGDLGDVPEELAVDASLGRSATRFELRMPAGICPPDEKDQQIDNAIGLFRQTVTSTGDGASGVTVTIERDSVVREPWVAPEHRDDLVVLSKAENRASRRKLRFRCD